MTVRISFSDLWTYDRAEVGIRREPLSHLAGPGNAGHVHGRLLVEIQGRALPYMGHFGPDDVCFGTWLVELRAIVCVLSDPTGEYTFDEGEEGQPAFHFARSGNLMTTSIVASASSGGVADPDWQGVECGHGAFQDAVLAFLADFRGHLASATPTAGEAWWARLGLDG